MKFENRLLLMSEIGDDLISEMIEEYAKEHRKVSNRVWLCAAAGICAIIALTIGYFSWKNNFKLLKNKEYAHTDNTNIEVTDTGITTTETTHTFILYGVIINGTDYVAAGPAASRKYHLPSNSEIKESDLGESIGEVTECKGFPELVGKKAYLYADNQSDGMIIILDMDGTYEFYERCY
ncbi:MAG: hypothetical protein IKG93_11790 [Clostridiales bacterium]|nr:hypothetical protein [Clostridiales bacterium]